PALRPACRAHRATASARPAAPNSESHNSCPSLKLQAASLKQRLLPNPLQPVACSLPLWLKYRFGIGTENLQPYRLIANLFQRILDQRIMLMAEEVDEEHVGPLATARGTGLDARQVHAVVVERLQQMMQRARTVAHGHDHRGLVVAGRRYFL